MKRMFGVALCVLALGAPVLGDQGKGGKPPTGSTPPVGSKPPSGGQRPPQGPPPTGKPPHDPPPGGTHPTPPPPGTHLPPHGRGWYSGKRNGRPLSGAAVSVLL